MGVVQEGSHTIQSNNFKAVVLKIDLSKPYDQFNWTYLRVILYHMGFDVPFISWVMGSLFFVSFVILINGVVASFFRPS